MGLPALHSTGSAPAHSLRFFVSWAFDSTEVLQVSQVGPAWQGMRSTFVHAALTSHVSAVEWDSLRLRSVLTLLRALPRRPARPKELEVTDGCVLVVEERQDSAYRVWYYDHPAFFKTPADSGVGVLFSRVFDWPSLHVPC